MSKSNLIWISFAVAAVTAAALTGMDYLADNRKATLLEGVEKYENALEFERQSLVGAFTDLEDDLSFLNDLTANHRNGIDSKLQGVYANRGLAFLGLYSSDCRPIRTLGQKHSKVSECSLSNSGKLIWYQEKLVSLFTLIHKLPSGHILKTGKKIDRTWLSDARVSTAASHIDFIFGAEISSETFGARLNYPAISEPILADVHPLSKYLAPIMSPTSAEKINSLPAYLGLVCLCLYIYMIERQNRRSAQNKLSHLSGILREKIRHTNQKEESPHVDHSFSATQLAEKLEKLEEDILHKNEENADLRNKIKALTIEAAELEAQEAQHTNIIRSFPQMYEKIKSQMESLDTVKSLLIKDCTKISQQQRSILGRWESEIHSKGPRKFLRSTFETRSEDDPEKSQFEEESAELTQLSNKLQTNIISASAEYERLERDFNQFYELFSYWSVVLSVAPQKTPQTKLSLIVAQASTQMQMMSPCKIQVETPGWTEPLYTTKAPPSILTYVIIELGLSLANVTQSEKLVHLSLFYRSGSIKDMIILSKYIDQKTGKIDPEKISKATARLNKFLTAYDLTVKPIAPTANSYNLAISWTPSVRPQKDSNAEKGADKSKIRTTERTKEKAIHTVKDLAKERPVTS